MTHTPLVIYILWHPASAEAGALASEIYRWFHASSDDLLRSGMGVPVFFRSKQWGQSLSTPRPIKFEEAECNIVVVLAEQQMVADPAWTEYLSEIGGADRSARLVPVALHPSAYQLPQVLRQLNFLRIDERNDPPADAAVLRARRIPRLLRQLTEVIGRELAARLGESALPDGGTPAPLTIFISHAKRDGVEIAEAIRSTIQNNGRLRVYFDDSDLPVGHAFASELEQAAVSGSAAMIAVVSDAFAARPWCRKEVALARKPRADGSTLRCWRIQPVLVVDALKSAPSRNIQELGNATVVRWSPEGSLGIVDLLMLDVLLGSYHRLRARQIKPAEGRHVISWTPDVPTLLSLQRQAEVMAEVVYPGYALPETEAQLLREYFPALELRTFEEIERPPELPASRAQQRVIGLSTAFNEDLGPLGFGREHLEEITLRIARCIVEIDGRIAFGGMLNSSGLTETLLTLVRTLSSDDDTPAGRQTRVPRVLSYQRWPSLPGPERIASDVGISEYVLIDNPIPAEARLADDGRVASPKRARELALTLSAMRDAMTTGGRSTSAGRPAPPLDARIIIGGAGVGFNGCLPGVLEEVLYALEHHCPVYVIGGFGGAARALARAVLSDEPQQELDIAYHRKDSSRFALVELGFAQMGEANCIEALFGRLCRAINEIREDVAGRLDNGLEREENIRLMQTDHVAEIVWLLRRGLARRLARLPC